MLPKIPNLARKKKDLVDPTFKIGEALIGFDGRYARRYNHISNLLKRLFLGYYSQSDATYRRDFLGEWIEEGPQRKNLNQIIQAIPLEECSHVRERAYDGERYSDSYIRQQITLIEKHILLPEAMELIINSQSASEASKDLKAFAKKARKSLETFARFVKPIKRSPKFRDRSELHIEWINEVLNQIREFTPTLKEIRRIRLQLEYYRDMSRPFTKKFNGVKVPSCKPKFLDTDEKKGRIINAYNPRYFSFPDWMEDDFKLNVPNNILWGPTARGNFIQGPNSMGKSVYLDTIAINIHLAMNGSYIFADSGELSFPSQLFNCSDIGDRLGTGHFETGLEKVVEMIREIDKNGIVLLDEVGMGTEPEVERIVAKGITDNLLKYGLTFFAVTHDKNSWENAYPRRDVKMLRVANLNDRKRRYNVWEGVAEGGYAMKMAQRMGVDPDSIDETFSRRFN